MIRKTLLGASVALTALGLIGLGTVHGTTPTASRAAIKEAKVADPVTVPSTAPVAETTTSAAIPVTPSPPNIRGAVPTGKGMWIYQPQAAEGGNARAIISKALAVGLTHIYVRTGSSVSGFQGADFLNQILPMAHSHGIKVYGWDFPYFDDVTSDVVRSLQAIRYGTPDGHRIDGFASDIELRSMGVNITPFTAAAYGASLRHEVGPNYPLIAVVPRPSPALVNYPYEAIVKDFDAIAPMIYWMQTDPLHAVNLAFDRLGNLGKPIIPIGQAYDGFKEGGPAGVPSPEMIQRFMEASAARGATGVSFWSWQHANDPAWSMIRNTSMFSLPIAPGQPFRRDQIRAYQVLLTTLGFTVVADGAWGPNSEAAVRAFQQASRIPVTGVIDEATKWMLFFPVAPPLKP